MFKTDEYPGGTNMTGIGIHRTTLVLGIAATVFFLVIRVRRGGVPALMAKAIASVFFMATACAALGASTGRLNYALLIIMGLVCGLLGDIWLDLKYVYAKDRDAYLFGGFYSFLAGHFFFIAAIFLNYDWTGTSLVLSVAPALIGIVAVAAMEKPMKLDYGFTMRPSS
ncbi:MAG TPA: lysoplasmalogenase family protein [Spirochaetota bacterium]|nr:lysoplasmalogenase family protein [Spirochaetota bacterium]HPL17441.1 lysoplasmalogenase family protein [Spirochaetota bacterium]HRS77999.1 lysoplasmalogenase family protein [Spirochaetota bacterium]HRT74768.1 lysoplasmalogenase family protein [Spirochaetota bacterium]